MKKFAVVVDTQVSELVCEYAPYVSDIVAPGTAWLNFLNSDKYEGVLFTYNGDIKNVFNTDLGSIDTFRLDRDGPDMWVDNVSMPYYNRKISQYDFFSDGFYGPSDVEIEIWGSDELEALDYAIAGFVQRGFKVSIVERLCTPRHSLGDFVQTYRGKVELI